MSSVLEKNIGECLAKNCQSPTSTHYEVGVTTYLSRTHHTNVNLGRLCCMQPYIDPTMNMNKKNTWADATLTLEHFNDILK